MATLISGREQAIGPGEYAYTADITSGTITLSISIDGNPFVGVTDGVLTATGTGVISLPLCTIKADMSGTATFAIDKVVSR